MEYRDDLKCLSWDALYHRLIQWQKASESANKLLECRAKELQSLRAEVKALQDSLAKLEKPPTWTPPKSLPDGEYASQPGDGLRMPGQCGWLSTNSMMRWFKDYAEPAPGRWQVTNGTATWLGE